MFWGRFVNPKMLRACCFYTVAVPQDGCSRCPGPTARPVGPPFLSPPLIAVSPEVKCPTPCSPLLNTVFLILDVPLIFTLLIVFHELGDFLAACWRGFVLGEVLVRFGKLISLKKLGGYWVAWQRPRLRRSQTTATRYQGRSEPKPRNAKRPPPMTPFDKLARARFSPRFLSLSNRFNPRMPPSRELQASMPGLWSPFIFDAARPSGGASGNNPSF